MKTKANKIEKTVEVKKANFSAEELVKKAQEEFAKKYPTPVAKPLPPMEEKEPENDDELEIIEVPIIKGKKVIPQNSAQAQKLLAEKEAKEFAEFKAAKKANAAPVVEEVIPGWRKALNAKAAKKAERDALAAKEEKKAPATRTNNPLGAKVIPEGTTGARLKKIIKEKKKANKPAGTSTRTKTSVPLSKMTIAQLEEIKGTISDVQWNKYYKIAGGVAKKGTTPVAPKKEAEVVAPIVKKVTRTVAPKKEAKVAPKPEPKTKVITLADFSLDEIIAELKSRGCKGSIHICTEVEL
jgi:hypothetical protein